MKPQFALILSSDGVALLHRQKRGWEELGSVAPDDPKFRSKLAEIRERALERSPGGIETKLVLPESQVLYTSIASPGRDDAARREAVRRALEGMTPYPVDDLAFDYEAEGEVLHIAVVARETLDEAEDFAAEHRLNPVSVVARLAGGSFTSEPFFGETTSAAAILPEGVRVERDVLPTQVTLKLTQPVVPPPADRQAGSGGAVAGAMAGAAEAAAAAPQIRVFYEDDALPLAPATVPTAAPQDAAEQAAAFLPADAEGGIHPDAGEDLGAGPGPAGAAAEADHPAPDDAVAALPEDVDSDPDDVGLAAEEAEVVAAREDDAGQDTPAGDEAMPAPEDEDAVALVEATPVGFDAQPDLDGDRLASEEAEALAAAEDDDALTPLTEDDADPVDAASPVHVDGVPDLGDHGLAPEEAVAAPEDDARRETATVDEAAHAPEDEDAVAEGLAAPDLGEDALALDGGLVDAAAVAPPPADEEADVADEAAFVHVDDAADPGEDSLAAEDAGTLAPAEDDAAAAETDAGVSAPAEEEALASHETPVDQVDDAPGRGDDAQTAEEAGAVAETLAAGSAAEGQAAAAAQADEAFPTPPASDVAALVDADDEVQNAPDLVGELGAADEGESEEAAASESVDPPVARALADGPAEDDADPASTAPEDGAELKDKAEAAPGPDADADERDGERDDTPVLPAVVAALQGARPAFARPGPVPGFAEASAPWREAGTTVPPRLGPVTTPIGVTSGDLPPMAALTVPERPAARSTTIPPGGPRTARARATALAQAPAGLRKVLARPRPAPVPDAADPAAGQGGAVFGRRAAPVRRSPLMAFVLTTGLVALLAAVGLWSAFFRPPDPVAAAPASEAPAVAQAQDGGVGGVQPDRPAVASLPPDAPVLSDPPADDAAGPALAAAPDETVADPAVPGAAEAADPAVPPLSAEGQGLAFAGAGEVASAAGGRVTVPAPDPDDAPAAAVPAAQPADEAAPDAGARSAAVAYAATGIWAEAPAPPAEVAEGRPVAGMRGAVDPRLPEPPPNALPVAGLSADAAPTAPEPPPPVSANPSAEALPDATVAEAADGSVVVVEGRPPVTPPGRPVTQALQDGTATALAAADPTAEGLPADAAASAAASAEDVPFALPGTPATPPRARTAAFVETARAAAVAAAEAAAIAEAAAAAVAAAEADAAEAAATEAAQPPDVAAEETAPAREAPNPLAGFRPRPRPFGAAPGTDDDAALAATPSDVASAAPSARLEGAAGLGAPALATAAALAASVTPLPQDRPDVAAAALRPASDPALAALRPRARPGAAVETVAATVPDPAAAAPGGVALPPPLADPALSAFRPRARPFAAGQPADAAAAAVSPDGAIPETAAAAPQSFAGATELAVAVTPVPRGRPQGFSERAQIAAAAAAAARAVASAPPPAPDPAVAAAAPAAQASAPAAVDPEAEADDQADSTPAAVAAAPSGGPRIPTSASVAGQATVENAIRLNRVNLIGIYGGSRDRRALVRLPSGRYVKVEVGDRVDGGRVAAISEREMRLVKGGRNIVLRVGEGS